MQMTGYPSALSYAAGQAVQIMLNVQPAERHNIERSIVRLICADTRPSGAGFQEVPVSWDEDQSLIMPAKLEPWQIECKPGSWGFVSGLSSLGSNWTLSMYFMPTRYATDGAQTLFDFAYGPFDVAIENGCLRFRSYRLDKIDDMIRYFGHRPFGRCLPSEEVGYTMPVAVSRWHWLLINAEGDSVRVHLNRLAGSVTEESTEVSQTIDFPLQRLYSELGFVIAARRRLFPLFFRESTPSAGTCDQFFNGRIELPWLAKRTIGPEEAKSLCENPERLTGSAGIIAAWDFSRAIGTDRMVDISGNGMHGCFINHPTQAVRGVRWDGTEQDWKKAPHHYGAIHFHEDDLTDAEWPASIAWKIPADAPSGIYAAKLRLIEVEDYVTFFVRPANESKRARVVFLVPTATYLAYANNRFSMYAAQIFGKALCAKDIILRDHPEVGLSLYDQHADGTGVHYSSHLRPVMDLKPNDIPWAFTADTNITAWLHHLGMHFDVVTDEDLHRDGAELLAPYQVVITGTHPEYASTHMLDGLESYLALGGRLMYMGGNGFYWRVAFDREKPGVMELRRTEGRGVAWDSQPGEYYLGFSGEYGGLWRNMDRPPNRILGVGFVALATEGSTGYRRGPDADNTRAEFIFRGTTEGVDFGFYGSVCGGAVSQEIDRWNPLRGSPVHALVVASSIGHPADFAVVPEEINAKFPQGDAVKLRADMTFFETPSGGAVFSTGSIGFAGALEHNNYNNDICRIATNVLRRFEDASTFAYPEPNTALRSM